MKNYKNYIVIAFSVVMLTSCFSSRESLIVPRAVSTITTGSLKDLNLQRGDYQIINTVTAEASIACKSNKSGTEISIIGVDDDFRLEYTKDKKGGWKGQFSGVVRAGYMDDAFSTTEVEVFDPAEIANRLAIYRLISQVKLVGGDAMLTPAILTETEQKGNTIYYKTTASAKAIVINNK